MKTKLSLLFITVLLLCSLGGGKKIARIIGCTAPLGGRDLPFIATYPDRRTYRGRTDDQGIAQYPSRGFNCRDIGLRHGLTFGFSLTADPSSIYLPAPPSSGMVYGQGMSSTYGPALVEYFDGNGYYIGETKYPDKFSFAYRTDKMLGNSMNQVKTNRYAPERIG